jgi:hypothetical protein
MHASGQFIRTQSPSFSCTSKRTSRFERPSLGLSWCSVVSPAESNQEELFPLDNDGDIITVEHAVLRFK